MKRIGSGNIDQYNLQVLLNCIESLSVSIASRGGVSGGWVEGREETKEKQQLTD